jgi:hypothetical protein
MYTLHGFLRDFVGNITAAEKEKLDLHEVKISFVAPPKNVSETLDIKNKKEFEANFQWNRYSVLLSDKSKTKWYTYLTELNPWGTKEPGTQEIVASDHKGTQLKGEPIDISVKDVEFMFPALLKVPELDPDLPESMVTYINGHEKDKGQKYSPTEFAQDFENAKSADGSNFYILISKTNDLKTPFGKTVGKVPVKSSAEKDDAVPGGFDIVKKLFYKQHEEQKQKKTK